jgi:hypothetical protein
LNFKQKKKQMTHDQTHENIEDDEERDNNSSSRDYNEPPTFLDIDVVPEHEHVDQVYFDQIINSTKTRPTFCSLIKRKLTKHSQDLKTCQYYKDSLHRRLPITEWLPSYDIKKSLPYDIFAGLTVGLMNLTQGMAYALIATLSPQNGLYISFFPLLIYAVLGTSKHLAIG